MAIPESQLETWSHQGSITQSSETYGVIKRALEASNTPYYGKNFLVFLQGSYGNDTNIYSESDVDVVIRLDSVFFHDLSEMPQEQQSAFIAAHTDSIYKYDNFKSEVLTTLNTNFGQSVKAGTRAIKISANGNRRNADVLIATEYRRYHKFISLSDQEYDLGICFFTSTGTKIANYPKQHSANCTMKHQATNTWFKPTVRILKNMRGKLVENGAISKDIAPSYFLEGLLYNVPNDKFGISYSDTLVACLNWILKADRTKFVCANEQYYLLRNSDVTWSEINCNKFLDEIKSLWKAWA